MLLYSVRVWLQCPRLKLYIFPIFLCAHTKSMFVRVSPTMCSPALQYLRPRGSASACVLTCPAPKTEDEEIESNHKRECGKPLPCCLNLHLWKCTEISDWLGRVVSSFDACRSPHSVPIQVEHRTFLPEHFCWYMSVLLGKGPAGMYSFFFARIRFVSNLYLMIYFFFFLLTVHPKYQMHSIFMIYSDNLNRGESYYYSLNNWNRDDKRRILLLWDNWDADCWKGSNHSTL